MQTGSVWLSRRPLSYQFRYPYWPTNLWTTITHFCHKIPCPNAVLMQRGDVVQLFTFELPVSSVHPNHDLFFLASFLAACYINISDYLLISIRIVKGWLWECMWCAVGGGNVPIALCNPDMLCSYTRQYQFPSIATVQTVAETSVSLVFYI